MPIGLETDRKQAEYCFESALGTGNSLSSAARWVSSAKSSVSSFGTQILGWEELTELSPQNSVRSNKLTEFGVWNRTLRNRIQPVSEQRTCNRQCRTPTPNSPKCTNLTFCVFAQQKQFTQFFFFQGFRAVSLYFLWKTEKRHNFVNLGVWGVGVPSIRHPMRKKKPSPASNSKFG